MSLNETITKLANVIRNKSLTNSKLGFEDMIKYTNSLTLDIDETKNMLRDAYDFGPNTAWQNNLYEQVGRENSSSYIWRTPSQCINYLSQEIEGAEYNTMYVWKFYARADQTGDKFHTELWGGEGSKNFTLTNQWKLCISAGMLTFANKPKRIYLGSVATNKGNVSMTMPVLVKYKLGGVINLAISTFKRIVIPLMGGVSYVA